MIEFDLIFLGFEWYVEMFICVVFNLWGVIILVFWVEGFIWF